MIFFPPASNELLTVQRAAERLHQSCMKTNKLALRPSALAGPGPEGRGCRARPFAGRGSCWDVGGLPPPAGLSLGLQMPARWSPPGPGKVRANVRRVRAILGGRWDREGRQTPSKSPPMGGERPGKARRRRGTEKRTSRKRQDQPRKEENRWRPKKPEQAAQDPRRPSRPGGKGPVGQRLTARPLVPRRGPRASVLRQRPLLPHLSPRNSVSPQHSPWTHGLLPPRSGFPAVGSRGHSRPALCGLGPGARGLRSLGPAV